MPRTFTVRLLGAIALAGALSGALTGLGGAATAAAAKPGIALTTQVNGSNAEVDAALAYATKEIRSASCTLDGASTPCGPAVSTGRSTTAYQVTLDPLALGDHTFAITVSLSQNTQGNDNSNNGKLTASTIVTITQLPELGPLCASLGGTLTGPGYFGWTCSGMADNQIAAPFGPICPAAFVNGAGVVMCPATENADLAAGNCIASNGTFVDYGPTWTCSVAAGDSRLLTIQGDCAADNGSFTDDGPDPAQPALERFTCLAPA